MFQRNYSHIAGCVIPLRHCLLLTNNAYVCWISLTILQRKDNKYGVYIINTHVLAEMRKVDLPMVVIDLGVEVSSGTVSADYLYERVTSILPYNYLLRTTKS